MQIIYKVDTQFAEKFQLEELPIEVIGPCIISLRPQQPTIGSLALTLSRECSRFGELHEQESAYLSSAFKNVGLLLQKTFNPQKINNLALMRWLTIRFTTILYLVVRSPFYWLKRSILTRIGQSHPHLNLFTFPRRNSTRFIGY